VQAQTEGMEMTSTKKQARTKRTFARDVKRHGWIRTKRTPLTEEERTLVMNAITEILIAKCWGIKSPALRDYEKKYPRLFKRLMKDE
jgi:hypothetical protein